MTFIIPSIAVSAGPPKTPSQRMAEMWRDPQYKATTLKAGDRRRFSAVTKQSIVAGKNPKPLMPHRKPKSK